MQIDWAEVRYRLNPVNFWIDYFGKVSYVVYICGQLVRLDAAPGRGFLASTDEYAKVACNLDAQWEQVADKDNYPGYVDAFVAQYVREIDAQHKNPRTAGVCLFHGYPPRPTLSRTCGTGLSRGTANTPTTH